MTTPADTGDGAADTAPAPGTRIRVTYTDDPTLYVGATGTVADVVATAALIQWDDHRLDDLALMLAVDRWEAVTDG